MFLKLGLLKKVKPPNSITELDIQDIQKWVYLRSVLQIQFEVSLIVRVRGKYSDEDVSGSKEVKNISDLPLSEEHIEDESIPLSNDRVRCEKCDGKGCIDCSKGWVESHLRRIKRIYTEATSLYDQSFPHSNLYRKDSLMSGVFDVIWESAVQQKPFSDIPVKTAGLELLNAFELREGLMKTQDEAIQRSKIKNPTAHNYRAGGKIGLADKPEEYKKIINHIKKHSGNITKMLNLASRFFKGDRFTPLYGLTDIIIRNHEANMQVELIENIQLNKFKITFEAVPVHKVDYTRTSELKPILGSSKPIEIRGEVYLQGSDELKVISHTEIQY